MAKYRKRPVIIDATQFLFIDGIRGKLTTKLGASLGLTQMLSDSILWWIQTPGGWRTVHHGDWVITGIKGEKYPCSPDIFDATYEAVED